jgi:hypothetical protein
LDPPIKNTARGSVAGNQRANFKGSFHPLGNRRLPVRRYHAWQRSHPWTPLVVCAEEPLLRIITLAVESASGPETPTAIHCLLKYIQALPPRAQIETEFVERHGVLHINRVRLDQPISKAEKHAAHGADLQVRDLHKSETCIRFRCGRIGTLKSLHYPEVVATELPVRDDCVEVEVVTAGVNFKVLTPRTFLVTKGADFQVGRGSIHGHSSRKRASSRP